MHDLKAIAPIVSVLRGKRAVGDKGFDSDHFRVTLRLGLCQRGSVVEPRFGHASEDVIRRAVDDAVDALDVVAHEALAHGFDDRDSARHCGLEEHRHLLVSREVEDLFSVLGEQRFVAGHYDFPQLDCAENERACFVDSAHQLDDNLHGRVIDDFLPAGCEKGCWSVHSAVFLQIPHGGLFHHEFYAEPLGEQRAVALQMLEYACADGAEARESDADLFHHKILLSTEDTE